MSVGPPSSSAAAESRPAAPQPPMGWYTDPADATQWRWWSGEDWEEFRTPRDPLVSGAYVAPSANAGAATAQQSLHGGTSDLRNRIPAQSLMEQLVRFRDEGMIESSRDGRRQYLPTEVRSWYSGAIGERHVANILEQLGPEWTVLHSVPVGSEGSDIDHVLIGPAGVYTINTKHHQGKSVWVAGRAFRVNNHPQHHISNAAFEARRAVKILSAASGLAVEAAGLIVVVGARELTIKAQPDGGDVVVGVVRESELLNALRSRRIYSDDQVRRIADAAIRPETWSSLPVSSADPVVLAEQFDALKFGVDAGERREKAWDTAGQLFSPSAQKTPHSGGSAGQRPASRRQRKRNSVFPKLIKLGVLAIVAIGLFNYFGNISKAPPPAAMSFASAEAEQASLAQAAGTAAMKLNQLRAEDSQPVALSVGPDSALLTPESHLLVALPSGTTAEYAPSADGLSYTLALTGPEFATVVTVTPETGVVPAPIPVP